MARTCGRSKVTLASSNTLVSRRSCHLLSPLLLLPQLLAAAAEDGRGCRCQPFLTGRKKTLALGDREMRAPTGARRQGGRRRCSHEEITPSVRWPHDAEQVCVCSRGVGPATEGDVQALQRTCSHRGASIPSNVTAAWPFETTGDRGLTGSVSGCQPCVARSKRYLCVRPTAPRMQKVTYNTQQLRR
jgi:hypothetical protein